VAWADLCRAATDMGQPWRVSCDAARAESEHAGACFLTSSRVRVQVVDFEERGAYGVWVTPETIWHHLDERHHDWRGVPLLHRLEKMGVCVAGLLDARVTPAVLTAWDLLQDEGLAETYHHLPVGGRGLRELPGAMLDAFTVIRAARNEIERARQRDQPRGGRRMDPGRDGWGG
jgi:hypothetical protein